MPCLAVFLYWLLLEPSKISNNKFNVEGTGTINDDKSLGLFEGTTRIKALNNFCENQVFYCEMLI